MRIGQGEHNLPGRRDRRQIGPFVVKFLLQYQLLRCQQGAVIRDRLIFKPLRHALDAVRFHASQEPGRGVFRRNLVEPTVFQQVGRQRKRLYLRIDAGVQLQLGQDFRHGQRATVGNLKNRLGQMQMADIDVGHERLDKPLIADIDEILAAGQRFFNFSRHRPTVGFPNGLGVTRHLLGQFRAVGHVEDVILLVIGHEFARFAFDIDRDDVEFTILGVVTGAYIRHLPLR